MEYHEDVQENENYYKTEKENVSLNEDKEVSDDEDSRISRDENFTGESSTSEDMLKNSSWKLGQLAWARMSIYPFWPCIITVDPKSLMTFQKVQTIGKSKTVMIHVHFFNDHGKHSWIPSHHMIPFKGIEDFRKRARLVNNVIRKKEPKFAAALTIKPSIFGTWQKAVAEAMDVLYELDMTALDIFKPKLKDLTNDIPKPIEVSKPKEINKKRKRKEEDNTIIRKLFKPTDLNNELRIGENLNNTAVENSLNLETPPVSPPNEDDLRAAKLQKQKRITKKINKLQPPDFEVYFERNYYTIKDQNDDATDEEVREYLYDVWERMAPEEKIKYRSTYKIENDS